MIGDTYDKITHSIYTYWSGKSEPFCILSTSKDWIQKNICVTSSYHLKLWGQLTSSGLPLYKLRVELIGFKVDQFPYTCYCFCHTTTDPNGFYYFDMQIHSQPLYMLVVQSPHGYYPQLLVPNIERFQSKVFLDHCLQTLFDYLKTYYPHFCNPALYYECTLQDLRKTNYSLAHIGFE